jgi:hypothetical protein
MMSGEAMQVQESGTYLEVQDLIIIILIVSF